MRIHVSIKDDEPSLAPVHGAMPPVRVERECASVVITVTGVDRENLPVLDADTLARLAEVFTTRPGQALPAAGGGTRDAETPPRRPLRDDYLDRLVVKHGGRILFIKTCEIDWIEAEGNYVLIHCGKLTYSLRETIGSLETQLNPAEFRRIHRSTIVNIDRIREMRAQARGDYRVILDSGAQLTLSRGYRETLHRLLGKSL